MIRPRVPRRTALTASTLVAALLAAACGSNAGPPGSPSTVTPTPAATASGPAVSGSGPIQSGPADPAPAATPWAGNAVLGIEALGVADGEIKKGIADFSAGVEAGDPALMRRAATGLAGVDSLLASVAQVETYEPMRPFASDYRTAIEAMSSAARTLEAAIDAGDADAVTDASRDLIDSFTLYADVQGQLAEYVVQLPEQKRLLVR